MKIIDVLAREILDSRGYPTIEVSLYLEGGYGTSSVPSGASTGSREALELRDGDDRYLGKGVKKAINNVLNVIKPSIIGKEFNSQKELDDYLILLDGTPNKSRLGANAILGVSMAFLKATCNEKGIMLYEYFDGKKSMPRCMFNILNGGMHADNNVDFQEFMIMPNYDKVSDQVHAASNIFHTLKKLLKEKGYFTGVGDEGGFAPDLKNNREALDLLVLAIKEASLVPGRDVNIALDIAATSLYDKEKDKYLVDGNYYSNLEMIDMYLDLIDKYPIVSIEDPFNEDDFESFAKLTSLTNIQIVGDDLFTTNKKLLQKGIDVGAGNAILLKVNQIGTVTETLDAIKLAKDNNYKTIISHRSGETLDTFIADMAVGLNLGQIKAGSISRGERIAKYNRLLLLEENLEK